MGEGGANAGPATEELRFEVRQFLSHLVVERKLSAATQQQALGALLFLYRNVLGR